jgi:hypothetical protein
LRSRENSSVARRGKRAAHLVRVRVRVGVRVRVRVN